MQEDYNEEDFGNENEFNDGDNMAGNTLFALIYLKLHWIVFAWSFIQMWGGPCYLTKYFIFDIIFGLIVRYIGKFGATIGEENFNDVVFLGHEELTVRCFKASCWAVAVATPIIIYNNITEEHYHYGFWAYIQSVICTLTFGIAA